MSKPASKTLIGIFVLSAIGLAVAAVVILGSGKFFKTRLKAVCYFEGSVGGLNVGAPVEFRGVKVGTVSDIILRFDPKAREIRIPVFLELEPDRIQREKEAQRAPKEGLKGLIDLGLRARLEMQSFVTGQMEVGLDFYPDRPPKFVGADPGYQEIPTIPTPFQELAKKVEQLPLEEIVKDINDAVKGIDRIVNSPEIPKMIQSLSQTAEASKSLVQTVNAKIGPTMSSIEVAVNDAQKLIRDVNAEVKPVSSNVQETLKQTQKLLQEIEGKATALASSIDGTVKDAQKLVQNIDRQVEPLGPSVQKTLASIEKTSDEAGGTLRQAQQTLATFEGNIGENSELVIELRETIRELQAALRAIKGLAKTLEQQPESVIYGKKKMRKE